MNYGPADDLDNNIAQYEMIWTLFHADKEEQPPEDNEDGVAVRLLKFLFGSSKNSSPVVQDECNDYKGKDPYHQHIYQPVVRTRPHPRDSLGPDGKPLPETSWVNSNGSLHDGPLIKRPSHMHESFAPSPIDDRSPPDMYEEFKVISALLMTVILLVVSCSCDIKKLVERIFKKDEERSKE